MYRHEIRPTLLRVIATAFIVLTAAACGAEYRGDGNFVPQVRKYSPLVKSRGFTLELPPFRPTADHVAKYRLDGLPLMNEEMTIALVTFIPPTRILPDELSKHDFNLPASHDYLRTRG